MTTITEFELQAYVDDQLDPVGRLEVADYLVRHPDVAARVLADLRARDAMRALAFGLPGHVSARIEQSAGRLDGALARARMARRLGRFMALAAIVVLGLSIVATTAYWRDWRIVAPAQAAVPVFIEEALMSHRTALVRAHMRSQPEIPRFDPADVRHATRIAVPQMPRGWHVLDVQLFPSDYGPSLQIVIDAGQKTPISLFAARASVGLPDRPTVRTVDGNEMAYWSREGTVYVLTGGGSARFLAASASDLADNQDAG
jgi:anti-sigma factor RsiW